MVVIDTEVMRAWTSRGGHVLLRVEILGAPLRLTDELLRVAGAIAALSGLYYAISVLTDSAYREEFLDELTGEMRDTFAARAAYLDARASTAADGVDPVGSPAPG